MQTIAQTAERYRPKASQDHLSLRKVGVWPDEVSPSETVTVTVEATATAGGLLGTFVGDTDFCVPTGFLNDGIRVDLELISEGNIIDQTSRCIADGVDNGQTWEATFQAPSTPGDVSFRIEASGAHSGNDLGSVSQTLTVTEEPENGGITPGPDPGDDDETFLGSLFPSLFSTDGLFSGPLGQILAILLAFGGVALLVVFLPEIAALL